MVRTVLLQVCHWVGVRQYWIRTCRFHWASNKHLTVISVPCLIPLCSNHVPSQVLLDATTVKNPAMTYGAAGIAGLGFSRLSSLLNSTNSSTGQSLLYNLFAANQSTPNFIAFALQRETQPGDAVEGTFSIGKLCYPTILC